MGRTPRIKKEPFLNRLKKSRHKKEPTGFLWNPQSEFTSDEGKAEVSRRLSRWNFGFLLLSFRQRLEWNEPLTMRKQIICLPDKR